MKHLLIAAAAVAVLTAAAAPAFAQPYGGYDQRGYDQRDHGYDRDSDRDRGGRIADREANLAQRIDEGERRGDLNGWQARHLRAELQDIRNQENRDRNNGYNRGRLSDRAGADIQYKLDRLSNEISRTRHQQR